MVVSSENVNSLVEISGNKLIAVICNIGYYIGRNTVCTDKNEIFIHSEISSPEPYSTVLFVGVACFLEFFDNTHSFAVFVQCTFPEPVIVCDTVFFQVTFKTLNIFRECIINKGFSAFGFFLTA